MADTAVLICPKCRAQMRSYERNGVVIDQCEDCRGIFLDRGELEQLLEAGSITADEHRDHSEHEREHWDHHPHERDGKPRRRMSSMLGDFLGGGE